MATKKTTDTPEAEVTPEPPPTGARYYDASKNTGDDWIPGVPLDDIDEETFNNHPVWLRQQIDASPMYRKTPVRAPKADAAPADVAPAQES